MFQATPDGHAEYLDALTVSQKNGVPCTWYAVQFLLCGLSTSPRHIGFYSCSPPFFSMPMKNISKAGITKTVKTVESAKPPSTTAPSPL